MCLIKKNSDNSELRYKEYHPLKAAVFIRLFIPLVLPIYFKSAASYVHSLTLRRVSGVARIIKRLLAMKYSNKMKSAAVLGTEFIVFTKFMQTTVAYADLVNMSAAVVVPSCFL